MEQKIIEKLFSVPRTIRLLAIYIFILLVGATVFVKLEEPAGKDQIRLISFVGYDNLCFYPRKNKTDVKLRSNNLKKKSLISAIHIFMRNFLLIRFPNRVDTQLIF